MERSGTSEARQRDEGSGSGATTCRAVLTEAVRRLEGASRSAPRRTAEWLLMDVMGWDRGQLYLRLERSIGADKIRQFEAMVGRRVEGEPLQHIRGCASFYGLELQVSPAVMVPRPETEVVVERSLACIEGTEAPRVLDVGTGSGCIALALQHERPDAEVVACDVSRDALSVARDNARELQLDIRFLHADIMATRMPELLPDDLDLLVSNPPYIPASEAGNLPVEVREYDPSEALFTGDDPLRFYRVLREWIQALCAPQGAFVLETHTTYAGDVGALLREHGLDDVQVEEDLSGRPRVVWGRRR